MATPYRAGKIFKPPFWLKMTNLSQFFCKISLLHIFCPIKTCFCLPWSLTEPSGTSFLRPKTSPIVKIRGLPIVKIRIFQLPSLLYPPRGTSGSLSEFWLRLINLDDDFDDFYNNSSKKLSLVLDELERFLKKGKSSEFKSWHDGDIFGLPIPLWVPWKPKKRWRPQNGKPI